MPRRYEYGFIGAGNMAEGIISAAVGNRLFKSSRLAVYDPAEQRRELMVQKFGVAAVRDSFQLVAEAQRIVLAVKPQSFAEAITPLADHVRQDQLIVSIMAGVSTGRVESLFPQINLRVVRVMPNLPILVGAGVAGVCPGRFATAQDVADVQALFDAGGASVVVKDESLIDAVTAISGSGPAYFYYFVEAMVAGGVACGLSEAEALKLAAHTCLGAARMMLETGEPPAELRRKVTSKGGTTQAALDAMNAAGVDKAIREAVLAAFDRAKELGKN
ncbi:MAG TPA: pyrroline-5-carboxylate reductase [Phycisphaerae bacterium]|nr:pyrroline-5-carboxylate reductase [Phycisphaerae bacterium]HRR86686.1 pyrroline-5-carboxylate reductase [Phycisphaerae bacterium]